MKALILIDFINEICHKDWKIAKKWYASLIEKFDIITKLNETISFCRKNNFLIINIWLTFSENYVEMPLNSKIFSKAKEFNILKQNSWSSDFLESINLEKSDIFITKNRVSWFYWTSLDIILKNNNITDIYIAWIATDLAVSSTVRDACDRDYNVFILWDLCVSSSINDSENELIILSKIANIISSKDLL